MAKPRKLSGRFHSRRRWRTRIALLAALAVVTAGSALFYATRPHRLAAIAGRMLEDISGAEARIDSATITLGGRIDLRNVELRTGESEGPAGELFHAEQVLIAFSPWEALRGRFEPQQMILVRPVVALTEVRKDAYNYERLVRAPDPDNDAAAPALPVLPRILIRDGRVRYGEVRDGEYRSLGEGLELTGRLQPDRGRPDVYRFELHSENGAAAPAGPAAPRGVTLSGEFDLRGLAVHADMTGFSFTEPHRAMLPARIREWWDRFEPSGDLRHVRFEYAPRDGFRGEVDIDGLTLTAPPLTGDDYRIRVADVAGTLRFEPDRITIHDLAGHAEGLRYQIDGEIGGYSAQAPFSLSLRTKAFRIPEDPRYAAALPPDVQQVFTMLTPTGWTRVSMDLARHEPGGRVEYEGRAHILSGAEVLAELRDPVYRARHLPEAGPLGPDSPLLVSRGMYHQFPYELVNCRGLVTFNADAIVVEHLSGDTPGGGRATITGTIGPPGPDPAIDLTIAAEAIPFDRTLYDALPEAPQQALGMFFHEPSWERLHRAGYFEPPQPAPEAAAEYLGIADTLTRPVSGDPEPGAALSFARFALDEPPLPTPLAVPVPEPIFDLGGRGDVLIKVQRPRGPNQHTTLHTAIDLADTNILFEHFPYPLHVLGGRVIVSPTRIVFEDIRAAGLHGGTGELAGHIDLPNGSDRAQVAPDLTIRAAGVPIDRLLLDVLPPHATDALDRLHADGTIELDGRIFHAHQRDEIDVDLQIAVHDATARPGDGNLTLDRIDGLLRVSLHGLSIERLVGHRGDGRIELAGDADWTDPDQPAITLRAAAENLHLDDHALDLLTPFAALPGAWTEAWHEHQPAGPFDADLSVTIAGDGPPDDFRLDLRPRDLSFSYSGRRLSLDAVAGSIVIEPGLIRLDEFTAHYDAAQPPESPEFPEVPQPPAPDPAALALDAPTPAMPESGGVLWADGTIHLDPEISARLAIRAAGSGVGPTLRHLVPAGAAQLLEDAHLEGRYRLDIPDLAFDAAAPPGERIAMNAALRLDEGAWRLGAPVSDFHGAATITLAHDPAAARPHAHLTLDARRLRAAGRTIDDFHMTLHTTAGAEHLVIPELSGRVGGGPLGGSGGISLTEGDFHLRIALADAQLAELATAPTQALAMAGHTGADGAPIAAPGHDPALHDDQDQPAGLLSASLALEGSWKQPDQVRGRGDILVREASLGGLPLVMGLVHISHLNLPIPDRFERAALHYYIRDGRLVFEKIELDAPRLRVSGDGAVALRSAELDITLTTANPGGVRLGPVTSLIDGLRNQLLTLHITGTPDSPRVRLRQFNALNRAWNDVFQTTPDP